MSKSIVLDLPERVEEALNEASVEDGVSANEVAKRAIDDYLFIRKFRRIREKMQSMLQPAVTDEEIFESVS